MKMDQKLDKNIDKVKDVKKKNEKLESTQRQVHVSKEKENLQEKTIYIKRSVCKRNLLHDLKHIVSLSVKEKLKAQQFKRY